MGGGSAPASLYRDVCLVGVAVFVAVTLFVSALGGSASAQTQPPGQPALAAVADHTAPTGGPLDATGAASDPAPTGDHHPAGDDHTAVTHPPAAAAATPDPRASARTPARAAAHGPAATAGHAHGGSATTGRAEAAPSPAGDHEEAHGGQDGHGDHGDHAGPDDADAGHDEHDDMDDPHGEHEEAAGHHAHNVGCAEDHPGTLALVEASRRNAARMNVGTMIAEGYIPYFDAMVPGNAATEGVGHWLNPKYIDDGNMLDPAEPESLLTDEFHRPIGLMFIQDAGVQPPPVYVNDDGSVCSPWHPHTDMPARFSWWFYRQVYDGAVYNEGDAMIPEETPSMMHLWIVDNPAGTYAAHDYPPASSREGFPPRLPVPGGSLPATPVDGVMPDPEEFPLGPEHTCPHCP